MVAADFHPCILARLIVKSRAPAASALRTSSGSESKRIAASFRGTRARAQQNSGAAISVLLKLMADPATPASGRIRAALGVFGLAHEALDLDIETRVAELERDAEASKPANTRRNR